jgi:hypothetical protein
MEELLDISVPSKRNNDESTDEGNKEKWLKEVYPLKRKVGFINLKSFNI